MTEKERYDLLLQELAELINAKNNEIFILKYQLNEAEKALKMAEGKK